MVFFTSFWANIMKFVSIHSENNIWIFLICKLPILGVYSGKGEGGVLDVLRNVWGGGGLHQIFEKMLGISLSKPSIFEGVLDTKIKNILILNVWTLGGSSPQPCRYSILTVLTTEGVELNFTVHSFSDQRLAVLMFSIPWVQTP